MSKYYTRVEVEKMVMMLASGKRMGEVLGEMKMDLTKARWTLQSAMARKVMKELGDLQGLQRGLVTGKRAGEAESGEADEEREMTAEMEEAARAALKEEAEQLEREDAKRYAS